MQLTPKKNKLQCSEIDRNLLQSQSVLVDLFKIWKIIILQNMRFKRNKNSLILWEIGILVIKYKIKENADLLNHYLDHIHQQIQIKI